MVTMDATVAPERRWNSHLRGHLLLFDRRPAPAAAAEAGARLLLVAALVEVVRLTALRWVHSAVPLWLLLPAVLGLGLLMVSGIAGVKATHLGSWRWGEWTATEPSYFLQAIVVANVVVSMVLADPIANRLAQPDMASRLLAVFVPYLFFGFYQELVYRAIVQAELVRRWGAPVGIVGANCLYTFGPLHWIHFASPASFAVPTFAAILRSGCSSGFCTGGPAIFGSWLFFTRLEMHISFGALARADTRPVSGEHHR